MIIETVQCGLCLNAQPYTECCASDVDIGACARLLAYETAKLPVYPPLTINGDVAVADYDKLRVYASRLAVDLSLLNGIIHRAARDAQKYVDVVERSAI